MVELEIKQGITPVDGVERILAFRTNVIDPVEFDEKQSKKGALYKNYKLLVVDEDGFDREICFLMESQLNNFILKFGKVTEAWKGKKFKAVGVKVKDYTNWSFRPLQEVVSFRPSQEVV